MAAGIPARALEPRLVLVRTGRIRGVGLAAGSGAADIRLDCMSVGIFRPAAPGVEIGRDGCRRGMATLIDRLRLDRGGNVGGDAAHVSLGKHARINRRRNNRRDVVIRLALRPLLLLHHDRRSRRRQRLEQGRVVDQLGHGPVVGDHHVIADAGDLVELRCEGIGQPDAAMRSGVARDDTGMQCCAGPGDSVHPRHWCAAIDVRMVPALLLDDAEGAEEGGMSRHPGRDLRRGEETRSAIDVNLLRSGRDHEEEWLTTVNVGDPGVVWSRLLILGLNRRRSDGNSYGRHAKTNDKP